MRPARERVHIGLETLLLAREPVAWGATRDVLTAENLLKARRMCEAFDTEAAECVAAA